MSRNKNFRGKGRSRSQSKSGRNKEVEVNIKDKNVNLADLPHIMTNSKVDNDPQWYMNLTNLGNDMASLPFNLPNGVTNDPWRGTPATGVVNDSITNIASAPGILSMRLVPTIGLSTDPTSAVNIAAQQLYTLTRKANSGATNYDKTDLMMTVLAMDSAYMLYEYILRAYRTIGSYNYMNRYMPNDLLQSMNFDPRLTYHISELRGILDLFAYKLASINVPDQLDIVKRHSWLFSNVYTDASSNKAQLYVYNPACLYVWTEGESGQPTYLKCMNMAQIGRSAAQGALFDIDWIKTAIDTVMNPILGSQDVGIISGDFAKAFGDGGMIQIRPVADYEALQPVYSQEVLLQMSNAFSMYTTTNWLNPSAAATNVWSADITQNNENLSAGPFLVQEVIPTVSANLSQIRFIKPILNYIDIEPNPGLNMVATRLVTLMNQTYSQQHPLYAYGTEILADMQIYNRVAGTLVSYNFNQIMNVQLLNTWNALPALLKFDWAPAAYMFSITDPNISGQSSILTPGYYGNTIDLCNYTYLEDVTLKNMHDVALMSLFAVKDFNYGVK